MKYKLIKKYPGSPEMGYEVDIVNGQIHNWPEIQYSPEYWEDITKSTGEILCYTQDGKPIREGDEPYWLIHQYDGWEYKGKYCSIRKCHVRSNGVLNKIDAYRIFSTSEAAIGWAKEENIMTIPMFSLKDIQDKLVGTGGKIIERLRREVEEKLKAK